MDNYLVRSTGRAECTRTYRLVQHRLPSAQRGKAHYVPGVHLALPAIDSISRCDRNHFVHLRASVVLLWRLPGDGLGCESVATSQSLAMLKYGALCRMLARLKLDL
jgi:hypothetical protein